jgi:K+-transporting ATPase A subunit
MKTRNPLDPIWRGVLRYTLYFLSVRVAIALVSDGAMQMLGNNCLITVAHTNQQKGRSPLYIDGR